MFCALRQTRNGCNGAARGCALQQRSGFVTQKLSCVKMQVGVAKGQERISDQEQVGVVRGRTRKIL
jgi:hypothetical protein